MRQGTLVELSQQGTGRGKRSPPTNAWVRTCDGIRENDILHAVVEFGALRIN